MPRDPLPQSGWKVLGIDLNRSESGRMLPAASLWAFNQCSTAPGRRTVKTEPLPGSRVTVTSPPIMRASLARDGKPEPRAAVALRGRGIGLSELREQFCLLLRRHTRAGCRRGRLPCGIGVARLRDAPAEWSRQYAMLGLSI